MISDKTFETKTALAALYLTLFLGFLSNMMSCDLQKLMIKNPYFRHFIGIVAFFFLFTILESKDTSSVEKVWIKTIFVYFIYILITKSKIYFALPVLIVLIIDQSIDIHIKHIKANANNNDKEAIETWHTRRKYLFVIMIILIICGVVSYYIRQKKEFGDKFSLSKFLFVNECK